MKYTKEDYTRILDTNIIEIGFSVRLLNALKSEDLTTMRDVVRCTRRHLECLRNLGKRSFGELDDFIQHYGLHLGMSASEIANLEGKTVVEVSPWHMKDLGDEMVKMMLSYLSARNYTIIPPEVHN